MRDRRHIIFYIASLLLLAVSQAAFFDNLRILGAKPNLVLVFVLITAVRMKAPEAMVFGVATGLFIDIAYGRYIGLYGLLFMYMAVLASVLSVQFVKCKPWWTPVLLPPLFIVYGMSESFIVRAIVLYATKSGSLYAGSYAEHMITRILPTALYDVIAMAVLFPLLFVIYAAFEPKPLIDLTR